MVDLGIVEVQFAAGPVDRPSPQQGVDEDVEILAEIVTGLDNVAAVAVDEGREVRGRRLIANQNAWSVLKIAKPQSVRVIAGPTAADLSLADAQLQPRGADPLQVTIEGRFGDRFAELGLEEPIQRHVGAVRLLRFQLDGLGDHRRRGLAGLAPIAPPLRQQRVEAAVAVLFPLPPQRGP